MSLDLNAGYWASSGRPWPPSAVLVECLSKCGPTSIPPDAAHPRLIQSELEVVQLRDHPCCKAAPERLMRGCMCYSLHCSPRLSKPQMRPDRKCSQVAIAIARGLVILRYDLCLFVACHVANHEPAFLLHLVTICALHPNLHHEFNHSIDNNPPRPLVACPLTRPSSRTCSPSKLISATTRRLLAQLKRPIQGKHCHFFLFSSLTPQCLSKAPTLPQTPHSAHHLLLASPLAWASVFKLHVASLSRTLEFNTFVASAFHKSLLFPSPSSFCTSFFLL